MRGRGVHPMVARLGEVSRSNLPSGHGWRVKMPRYAWPRVHEWLLTHSKRKWAAASIDGSMVVSLAREYVQAVWYLLPNEGVEIKKERN